MVPEAGLELLAEAPYIVDFEESIA